MTNTLTLPDLSQQQALFVAHFLELGGSPEHAAEAAKRAGYADNDDDAARSAAVLLGSKRIVDAIKAEVAQRLTIASGAAVTTIMDLAVNAKSEQVRLAAAKEILDRGVGPVMSRNAVITARVTVDDLIAQLEGQERG